MSISNHALHTEERAWPVTTPRPHLTRKKTLHSLCSAVLLTACWFSMVSAIPSYLSKRPLRYIVLAVHLQADRKAVNKYYPPEWTPDQVLARYCTCRARMNVMFV